MIGTTFLLSQFSYNLFNQLWKLRIKLNPDEIFCLVENKVEFTGKLNVITWEFLLEAVNTEKGMVLCGIRNCAEKVHKFHSCTVESLDCSVSNSIVSVVWTENISAAAENCPTAIFWVDVKTCWKHNTVRIFLKVFFCLVSDFNKSFILLVSLLQGSLCLCCRLCFNSFLCRLNLFFSWFLRIYYLNLSLLLE